MKNYDLVVIGGGPAGLAAACQAYDHGVQNLVIVERDKELGGILNQCIHNGFGLHRFHEELTGPEYANRYIEEVNKRNIDVLTNTLALDLKDDLSVTLMSMHDGMNILHPQAVILAMGCRERPRGAINIPGERPSGVFTAGTAQRLMNIEGYKVGNKVVILGSGDIGLIMARRMTLEGSQVCCVAEVMPFSGGLKRNIVQCLEDFDIPLYLSTTITKIVGRDRVEGVWLSQVDEKMRPLAGTERFIECDTVLFSVGLIPENELSLKAGVMIDPRTKGAYVDNTWMTSVPGIFACGNVLHVHDLVDNVSAEADIAGKSAASYIQNASKARQYSACAGIGIVAGKGVSYTLPQKIFLDGMEKDISISFRVKELSSSHCVVLRADNIELYRKRKHALAPGQMEQIRLKKADLEGKAVQKIEISIEE